MFCRFFRYGQADSGTLSVCVKAASAVDAVVVVVVVVVVTGRR